MIFAGFSITSWKSKWKCKKKFQLLKKYWGRYLFLQFINLKAVFRNIFGGIYLNDEKSKAKSIKKQFPFVSLKIAKCLLKCRSKHTIECSTNGSVHTTNVNIQLQWILVLFFSLKAISAEDFFPSCRVAWKTLNFSRLGRNFSLATFTWLAE